MFRLGNRYRTAAMDVVHGGLIGRSVNGRLTSIGESGRHATNRALPVSSGVSTKL